MYQLDPVKTQADIDFVEKLKTIPRIKSRLIASSCDIENTYILFVLDKRVGFSAITPSAEGIEVSFVIAPEEENQGYGKVLIDRTIVEVKQKYPNKPITLYVLADNYKAYQIFRNQGFYSVYNIIKMQYEGK